MKILNIFSTASFIKRAKDKAREENWDPLKAGRELGKEILLGYAIYYGFLLLVFVGILTALGFFEVLGGPYVVAQVILFLLVGTLLLAVFCVWWVWHKIKRKLQNLKDNVRRNQATDTTTTDATIISGQIADDDSSNE